MHKKTTFMWTNFDLLKIGCRTPKGTFQQMMALTSYLTTAQTKNFNISPITDIHLGQGIQE